jgi:hypothetical protein
VKTYPFNELTAVTLAEVAAVRYEPMQPSVWDDLAGKPISERERSLLGAITDKLRYFRAHMANEATVWARAIYPMLALAERGAIFAFSRVPLAATFGGLEVRGEADGALAGSVNEEPSAPYVVVIEAKRGVGATEPVSQLLGAMLCAAQKNEHDGHPAEEIYGVYTIADVWTFVRGRIDWSQPKPAMRVLPSREYAEKTEAATILAILESIVEKCVEG